MWTRLISFTQINLVEALPDLFVDCLFYDLNHPFSLLNNSLVSLGTIVQCISENSSADFISILKVEYEKQIEIIKKDIYNNNNNNLYQLDENILKSIQNKLLLPYKSIDSYSFLENHKANYFEIMNNICISKSVKKVFIYDNYLFDQYKLRTNYDSACHTLIAFSGEPINNQTPKPSIENLPFFLQSRNTIVFV